VHCAPFFAVSELVQTQTSNWPYCTVLCIAVLGRTWGLLDDDNGGLPGEGGGAGLGGSHGGSLRSLGQGGPPRRRALRVTGRVMRSMASGSVGLGSGAEKGSGTRLS